MHSYGQQIHQPQNYMNHGGYGNQGQPLQLQTRGEVQVKEEKLDPEYCEVECMYIIM